MPETDGDVGSYKTYYIPFQNASFWFGTVTANFGFGTSSISFQSNKVEGKTNQDWIKGLFNHNV